MDTIENIFVCDGENQPTLNSNRIKMGEVYKIQNDQYSLVCIHCSDEFQYFSEFALHVEDHLKNMIASDNGTVQIKEEDELHITDEHHAEEIESNIIADEPQSNNAGNNKEKDAVEKTIDSVEETEQFDDNHFDDYTDEEESFDPPNLKNNSIKQKEEEPINVDALQKKSIKRKKKEPKHTDIHMSQLLAEIGTNKDANRVEYKRFINEVSTFIFAMDLIDTQEAHLLAKFSLSNFKYEKSGDVFLCPVCKVTFEKNYCVRQHIFSHASEKCFRCCLCSKRFPSRISLQSHMRYKHISKSIAFECFICHKEFPKNQLLKKHIRSHNDHEKSIKCSKCHRKFKELRQYQRHKVTHARLYECHLCKKNYRSYGVIRKHFDLHTKPKAISLCTICGRQFNCKSALTNHMEIHENGDSKPYKCTLCESSFRVRRRFLLHNRKKHKLYADNQQPVCQECGESFENKRLLGIHKKTHPIIEERRLFCVVCNFASWTVSGLRKHMENHNAREHECNVCNKKNLTLTTLKAHIKMHSATKKYKCTICNKAFISPSALKEHMYSHDKEKQFECDACSKRLSNAFNLKRHRQLYCHQISNTI